MHLDETVVKILAVNFTRNEWKIGVKIRQRGFICQLIHFPAFINYVLMVLEE